MMSDSIESRLNEDEFETALEILTFKLSFLRTKVNLTQKEVAEVMGVHGSKVSKFENAVIIPSYKELYQLAEIYKVSLLDLVEPKYNMSL